MMGDSDDTRKVLKGYLDNLLASREHPKTICPSEVARALSRDELHAARVSSWRDLMPEIREIVAEIWVKGMVEVLQKGCVLDGDLGEGLADVKGPIRIR